MDVEKYIASGVLELYMTGSLEEEENWEVYQNAIQYPKINEEILAIEAALFELSKSVFPEISRKKGFDDLKNRIGRSEIVEPAKKTINKNTLISQAFAVLFAIGLLWLSHIVSGLTSDIKLKNQENQVLSHQVIEARDSLGQTKIILSTITNETTKVIPMEGQKIAPASHTVTYWNNEKQLLFVDAKGLPEPPVGFVYQAWVIKSDPLEATSLGVLTDPLNDRNQIFALKGPDTEEVKAFGITLEPAGGSESPNLERLYTLGAVSS